MKHCLRCGIEIKDKPSHMAGRKYCSKKCVNNKNMPYKVISNGKQGLVRRYQKRYICNTCGKEFYSHKTQKFCSRKCVLWNGGITKRSHGYIWEKDWSHPNANKQGYVYQHRIAAEKKLGRRLEKWEVVHHIDRNRSNNNPDNLEVYNQYDHACMHKDKWWTKTKFWHKDEANCETINNIKV